MVQLNKQQEEAASHVDGPCLVVACPGSGKTRLLVERTARLIELGNSPNQIVSVTFTNKAADEMRNRICERLQVEKLPNFVGTFHSLCALMLRRFGEYIGYNRQFSIADSDDQIDLLRQIARQNGQKIEKSKAYEIARAVNNHRENMTTRIDFEESLEEDFEILIADIYLERLKEMNSLDFSGLLSETIRLLDQEKQLRDKISNSMKYVQVDEVQDTNFAQFYLLNILSEKWNNILCVGDLSQSVYGWRGARCENIIDFTKKYEDCKTIELPLNYRSTPEIVKTADKLIRYNKSHMGSDFISTKPSGESVKLMSFSNQLREADFVGQQSKRLIEEGGWKPEDIAVLYRTNAMSEPIERACVKHGLQYILIGARSFYDRREVKDCLAMLRLAVNPLDCISFHRVGKITNGLGDVTIGKIESISQSENIPLIQAAEKYKSQTNSSNIKQSIDNMIRIYNFSTKEKGAAKSIDYLVSRIGYEDFLKRIYKDDIQDRLDNISQLMTSAANFETDSGDKSAEKFLQNIALISSADKKNEKDSVSLMTLHSCKGLEFPIVFMIGVEHGMLPHYMSLKDPNRFDALEEERRLCYVGMTRAEHILYMTYNQSRVVYTRRYQDGNYHQKCKPSQFLYECGLLKRNQH